MIYAKIENNICVNTVVCYDRQQASNFDKTLVILEEGFGIGDYYVQGVWSHPPRTEVEVLEHTLSRIEERLGKLDKVINRATEELYTALGVTPHPSTKETMEKKQSLREEWQKVNAKLEELRGSAD